MCLSFTFNTLSWSDPNEVMPEGSIHVPPILVRQRLSGNQGLQETVARHAKNPVAEKLFRSSIQQYRPRLGVVGKEGLQRLQIVLGYPRGILDLNGRQLVFAIDDKVRFRPGARSPEVQ